MHISLYIYQYKNLNTIEIAFMANREELIMTCLEYETLFDDFSSVDIASIAQDIPYLAALSFIVAKHHDFYYCLSDLEGQKKELYELRCSFFEEKKILSRLDEFIVGQDNPYLIDNLSTIYFEMYILQYSNRKSKTIELTPEQRILVYKLYLYCSTLWLRDQQYKIENLNVIDFNLKVDVPVTEFKFPSDFYAQLYKANEFFVFCESRSPYDTISKWLICDKGKNNFQEYLLDIFELFRHTISDYIFKKSKLPNAIHWILDNYCIGKLNQEQLCENKNKGIRFLRNHFFVKIDDDSFLLLNPTFLIDKFYEGIVFDLWKSIENHKGTNTIADKMKDFTVLKSMLGSSFSEEHLFYTIMDKCFTSTSQIKVRGSELSGVEAPPDYYLREGNNIFFFECKDVLINNDKRYSTEIETVKKELLDKLCKDSTSERKGGAQLLYSINKYINENSLSKFDRPYNDGDKVYPIIVTTNSVFDAYGVNQLIMCRFIEIAKNGYSSLKGKLKLPIIINMDCFIILMNDLHNGNIKFSELLDEYQSTYLEKLEMRFKPSFYHFIRTLYHGQQKTKAEISYLFGSLFESLGKIATTL